MIWDCVIVYFAITLALAGWNVGLVNSWRTPIAMVLSTVVARYVYINVSALLIDGTHLPAAAGVFIGYIMVWLVLEFAFAFVLQVFFPAPRCFRGGRLDRLGGAILGGCKAAAVLCFAMLASIAVMEFPAPPDYPLIALWISESGDESNAVRTLQQMACGLPPAVVKAVVSQRPPDVQVTYTDWSAMPTDPARARRFRDLFEAMKQLEREAGIGP
jgi:hypothetical protein